MRTMQRVALILLCLGAATAVLAQEKKISTTDLPAPVLSAFQKSYPGASINGVSRESEEGKTFYEIESVEGAVHRDILYAPDGTMVELEESMVEAELPAAVKATLAKKEFTGTVEKVEKVTKGKETTYEMRIHSGSTMLEVMIGPDGKVIKQSTVAQKKKPAGKHEEEDEDREKD
jgi:hypothetical protein